MFTPFHKLPYPYLYGRSVDETTTIDKLVGSLEPNSYIIAPHRMGNAGQIQGKSNFTTRTSLVVLSRGGRVGGGILELLLRWHTRVHGEVVMLRLLLHEGHV
jgi:hypothetical protein